MRELDRDGMLALTPDIYLAEGFFGADGKPRPELLTDYAAAAVAQLHAADAAPQEVGFTIAGIGELLALSAEEDPGDRLWSCLDEASTTVASIIQQPNNTGLRRWLYACAEAVGDENDLDAFMAHIEAVDRIYAQGELIAPPDED